MDPRTKHTYDEEAERRALDPERAKRESMKIRGVLILTVLACAFVMGVGAGVLLAGNVAQLAPSALQADVAFTPAFCEGKARAALTDMDAASATAGTTARAQVWLLALNSTACQATT